MKVFFPLPGIIYLWNGQILTFCKVAFGINILVCHLDKAYNSKLLEFWGYESFLFSKAWGSCRHLAFYSFSGVAALIFFNRKKKKGKLNHARCYRGRILCSLVIERRCMWGCQSHVSSPGWVCNLVIIPRGRALGLGRGMDQVIH